MGQPKIDMRQVAKALDLLELPEPMGLRLSLNTQLPIRQRRQCRATISEQNLLPRRYEFISESA